jgi:hypothetical protein
MEKWLQLSEARFLFMGKIYDSKDRYFEAFQYGFVSNEKTFKIQGCDCSSFVSVACGRLTRVLDNCGRGNVRFDNSDCRDHDPSFNHSIQAWRKKKVGTRVPEY